MSQLDPTFEAFAQNPQTDNETRKDYFVRISGIVGKAPLTIKQHFSFYKSKVNEYCEDAGVPTKDVKHGWVKTKDTSLFFTNPDYEGAVSYDQIRDKLVAELKSYSPKYPTIKRNKSKDGHLLVIDPADVHIGKLCEALRLVKTMIQTLPLNAFWRGYRASLISHKGIT